jgi:2-amino-4-hydroxy-6-hydroxymethyldihydropteridine diphosphokinase
MTAGVTAAAAGAQRSGDQRGADDGARVVLALGSNLGDRLATLQESVTAVAGLPGTEVLAVSPVYETVPVGGPAQPDYLNAVLIVRTSLPSRELLNVTQSIETDFKRTREVRFGPRTLDIDIISYGDEVSGNPVLTLPHPRAHERAFVLVPWHDVDPHAELPGRGHVEELLTVVGTDGVRRRSDAVLRIPVQRPRGLS